MSSECIPATIELKIPCKAEFVSIARLTVLGISNRLKFTYDDIEDIRLAVGEACALSIDKSNHANNGVTELLITSNVYDDRLSITIEDIINDSNNPKNCIESLEDYDRDEIVISLIHSLVDEYTVEQLNDNRSMTRITKFVEKK